MKDMLFFVNPRSGKEQIRSQLLDILDVFSGAGYLPRVHITQNAEDAKRLAAELGGKTDLIVCSGGDGTLNNVVSGIMGLPRIPRIGYIPSGSTNDFARSLKIPVDPKKAAEAAVSGTGRKIDVGKFGDDQYFVYVAAFGAFTEVSYKTPQDIKNILGHQAYLLESLKALPSIKPRRIAAEWDDGSIEGEFIFGMITNSRSVAGFKTLAPREVSLYDGLFEGLFIRMPRTPADLTDIVTSILLRDEENENAFRFRASRIRVVSEYEIPWVLDGEYGGTIREAVIENLHGVLSLNRSPQG